MSHAAHIVSRQHVLVILILLAGVFLADNRLTAAQEDAPAFAALTGTAYRLVDQTFVDGLVVDETEVPVIDGRIAIPELGIDEPLAADGTFSFSNLPVSADQSNPTEVTVIFTAPGLGSFTYEYLRLYPGTVGWILIPQMIDTPRVNDRRDAHLDRRGTELQGAPSAATEHGAGPASDFGCYPLWEVGVLPQTIRVWHNGDGQDGEVHEEDFVDYLKAVLPNEWIPSWQDDSLLAGAIAVKSFAWWHATHGFMHSHKNNPHPNLECYDVDATDLHHQVFDPTAIHPYTSAAVDVTWWNNYMFEDDGTDVIEAFYEAGFGDACEEFNGNPAPGNRMSAWGSHACANLGYSETQILEKYYLPPPAPTPVFWTHVYGSQDSDNDGCKSGYEVGSDEDFGGRRNPLDPWDFYDVSVPEKDGYIDLFHDILGVIAHQSLDGSPPYDAYYDRGPSPQGANVWEMTAPDGVINLFTDILGVIAQFGHDCT